MTTQLPCFIPQFSSENFFFKTGGNKNSQSPTFPRINLSDTNYRYAESIQRVK